MNSNEIILKNVIDSTESIFSRIAENYPKMLNEFESGLKQASDSIDSLNFVNTEGSAHGEVRLSEHLNQKKSESRENLQILDGYKDKNKVFLDRLSYAINEFGSSQEYIEEIRDISESLQIVSLNALCNAVKVGKGGEGFSVITDNLKNITEDTIEKTSSLEKRGATVSKSLEDFYGLEEDIDSSRTDVVSMIEEKVMSSIEAFQSEAEIINRLFQDLNNDSARVKTSIKRIMQELQQQDLIRQTIDQILFSLNELPEEYQSCDILPVLSEEKIDEMVFSFRLINLTTIMLDDIIQKLRSTIEIFTDNFSAARKVFEYIQNEKDKAVDSFIKNLEVLNKLSAMGADIREKTEKFALKRQQLINLIVEIIAHVSGIEDEFASFDKISGWLQNVAVLSRIELSRSSGLEDMKESVNDMSELVIKIQEQISRGEKETGQFISGTAGIFEEYKTYAEEEMYFLRDFTDIFLKNINEIIETNNFFSGVLKNFDFFTEDFCRLFDLSEKELDDLREITEDLIRARENLVCVEVKLKPQLESLLKGGSVQNWDIRDDNMNRIIKKFTIYSHKKTAGDFSGVDIEDSALDAGEVTLF